VVVVAVVIVAAGVAMAVHVGLLGGAGSGSGPAPTGGSVPTAAAAGGWQTVDLPTGFSATGISCVSADDCWLIGATHDRNASPAVWRYSGGAWTSVAIAGVGSGALEGLTCVSADDCWAVGQHITVPQTGASDAVVKPLIEHDAGAGFSPVTGPPAPGDADSLSSVTCAKADDCWAGGNYAANSENGGDGIEHPLLEHYDGSAWTLSALAPPVIDYAGLDGTACLGPDECWASVGTADGGVVEEFDGASWTVVSAPQLAPSPGFSQSGVGRVTCIVADDCWAVGSTGAPTVPNLPTQPLIAHYTGAGWVTVSSPHVSGPNGATLAGVACLSASDCWAVGATMPEAIALPAELSTPSPDPALFPQPVIEHYDGSAWTVLATPQSGTDDTGLADITCAPATGACFAAGMSALWILTGA